MLGVSLLVQRRSPKPSVDALSLQVILIGIVVQWMDFFEQGYLKWKFYVYRRQVRDVLWPLCFVYAKRAHLASMTYENSEATCVPAKHT